MRALVTGSNGFIGSFLVEKLLHNNFEVRCLVRRTSNLRWLKDLDVELFYGELSYPPSLGSAVRGIDVVFHLGGVTRALKMEDFYSGNVLTTQNLLSACLDYGFEHQKLVYVSSQAAGGPSIDGTALTEENAENPISMYGRSKYAAEQAVWKFAQYHPATIVRPPSVYGPRDADFFTLFKSAQRGFVPIVGGGRQRISIIHVSDLVDGIFCTAVHKKANGELFFLSSDEDVSFAQVAQSISAAIAKKVRLINIPLPVVRLIVALSSVSSVLTKKPSILNKDKYAEMRQAAWLCSNEKAKQLLGFNPRIHLDEGMHQTAEWYKAQGWL